VADELLRSCVTCGISRSPGRRLMTAELAVPVSVVRILAGAKTRTKPASVAGATASPVLSLAPGWWSDIALSDEPTVLLAATRPPIT
jgi:hypothetical protein